MRHPFLSQFLLQLVAPSLTYCESVRTSSLVIPVNQPTDDINPKGKQKHLSLYSPLDLALLMASVAAVSSATLLVGGAERGNGRLVFLQKFIIHFYQPTTNSVKNAS